jgi:hypothetical protein
VISYQDLLSKPQAANFGESLHTLIEHLEVQQHQLAAALQDTTTTLQVLKRLNGGQTGQVVEADIAAQIAQLETISLPTMQSIAPGVAVNLAVESVPPASESPADSAASPQKSRSTTKPSLRTVSKSADNDLENRAVSASFHPRRSILKEFQGKILRDAIKIILKRKQGQPVSIDEIMVALYGKNISEKNAEISRTVVIHELSKGKTDGHWTGVPQRKGYYWIPD